MHISKSNQKKKGNLSSIILENNIIPILIFVCEFLLKFSGSHYSTDWNKLWEMLSFDGLAISNALMCFYFFEKIKIKEPNLKILNEKKEFQDIASKYKMFSIVSLLFYSPILFQEGVLLRINSCLRYFIFDDCILFKALIILIWIFSFMIAIRFPDSFKRGILE